MNSIVTRIKEYLNAKGIKPSQAESAIGVSNGTLSKPFNNQTSIKTDTLEKFLKFYSDLNPVWLVTGNEAMTYTGNISKKEPAVAVKTKEPQIIDLEKTILMQDKVISAQEKTIKLLERALDVHDPSETSTRQNVVGKQLIKH